MCLYKIPAGCDSGSGVSTFNCDQRLAIMSWNSFDFIVGGTISMYLSEIC